jgi:two-component system, OmpR family, sensor kinase
MLRRMSLRARLLLGVVVLAAAGLAAADIATYTSLRSFLVDRVDSSLDQEHLAAEQLVGSRGRDDDQGPSLQGIAGDYLQVRKPSGAVVGSVYAPLFEGETDRLGTPKLPKTAAPAEGASESDDARYLTVPAADGGSWRVRIWTAERVAGYQLLLAQPLTGVTGTLHRLLLIEALATAAVLAGIAGLGLWVVRAGLRPLRSIEVTAAAIAAGDLSRRVERADERTEVGRLGSALNTMLGHIERAFRAREASEAKLRRFVADASHELRTPLAAVRAYAELFDRGAADRPDDLARAMSGIGRESRRMSDLVDDLLLLARLDEGRPLARDPVRLDEVAAEAVETACAVEPERPVRLVAGEVVVTGDRDRLRQVLDNLLANVRAHTPAGTAAEVRVRAAGDAAVVEVADEGPGLDRDALDHVFERFYRVDPSRARASGGAGLGLAIVAAVAEAHGGSASASSEADGGATFTVSLPLRERDPQGLPTPLPGTSATIRA